eukprot:2352612-Karenia_brevis.AAC.1
MMMMMMNHDDDDDDDDGDDDADDDEDDDDDHDYAAFCNDCWRYVKDTLTRCQAHEHVLQHIQHHGEHTHNKTKPHRRNHM